MGVKYVNSKIKHNTGVHLALFAKVRAKIINQLNSLKKSVSIEYLKRFQKTSRDFSNFPKVILEDVKAIF